MAIKVISSEVNMTLLSEISNKMGLRGRVEILTSQKALRDISEITKNGTPMVSIGPMPSEIKSSKTMEIFNGGKIVLYTNGGKTKQISPQQAGEILNNSV